MTKLFFKSAASFARYASYSEECRPRKRKKKAAIKTASDVRAATSALLPRSSESRPTGARSWAVQRSLVGEFQELRIRSREELQEVFICHVKDLGHSWKQLNADYVRFTKDTKEQLRGTYLNVHQMGMMTERWYSSIATIISPHSDDSQFDSFDLSCAEGGLTIAYLADSSSVLLIEDRDAAPPAPDVVGHDQDESLLNAECIKLGELNCECWVEIAKGMRVKTAIPNASIQDLVLRPGDEFFWSAELERAFPKRAPNEFVSAEIQRELDELDREYFEELRHLETGLES